jgi:hypothetical protein
MWAGDGMAGRRWFGRVLEQEIENFFLGEVMGEVLVDVQCIQVITVSDVIICKA